MRYLSCKCQSEINGYIGKGLHLAKELLFSTNIIMESDCSSLPLVHKLKELGASLRQELAALWLVYIPLEDA